MSAARDPREVEMLAIVNMQAVPEDVRKGVQELALSSSNNADTQKAAEAETSLASQADATAHNAEESDDEILSPGTKIRPNVTVEDARKFAERLYGIVASEIKELDSYDDRNFLIKADCNIKNPILANRWPHGYILKVHNALDSRKGGFIEAQTQLQLFLGQQNIRCPRPVMNITGKYFSLERLVASGNDDDVVTTTSNCVRLLEFVPGEIFNSVPVKTAHLYYQAGEFVARLDTALRHFEHAAYARHRSLWQLDQAPRLKEFVYALHDETRQEIVEQVLEQFERKVLSRKADFAHGIIHGDFNEQNILVEKRGADEWRISGVIDFGDTSRSCYVFELAIAMAYMMLQSGELSTGGLVLAGYGTVRTVPEPEREVLKLCVAARLCQSLVMGAYSHAQDPGNAYLLSTQAAGWLVLEKLWSEPELLVRELWQATGDRYLTQSTK